MPNHPFDGFSGLDPSKQKSLEQILQKYQSEKTDYDISVRLNDMEQSIKEKIENDIAKSKKSDKDYRNYLETDELHKFYVGQHKEIIQGVHEMDASMLKVQIQRTKELLDNIKRSSLEEKEFLKEQYENSISFLEKDYKAKSQTTKKFGNLLLDTAERYLDARGFAEAAFENNPLMMGVYDLASSTIKSAREHNKEKKSLLARDAHRQLMAEKISSQERREKIKQAKEQTYTTKIQKENSLFERDLIQDEKKSYNKDMTDFFIPPQNNNQSNNITTSSNIEPASNTQFERLIDYSKSQLETMRDVRDILKQISENFETIKDKNNYVKDKISPKDKKLFKTRDEARDYKSGKPNLSVVKLLEPSGEMKWAVIKKETLTKTIKSAKNSQVINKLLKQDKKDLFFKTRDEARQYVKSNPQFRVKDYGKGQTNRWSAVLDDNPQFQKSSQNSESYQQLSKKFNEDAMNKFQALVELSGENVAQLGKIEKYIRKKYLWESESGEDDFTRKISLQIATMVEFLQNRNSPFFNSLEWLINKTSQFGFIDKLKNFGSSIGNYIGTKWEDMDKYISKFRTDTTAKKRFAEIINRMDSMQGSFMIMIKLLERIKGESAFVKVFRGVGKIFTGVSKFFFGTGENGFVDPITMRLDRIIVLLSRKQQPDFWERSFNALKEPKESVVKMWKSLAKTGKKNTKKWFTEDKKTGKKRFKPLKGVEDFFNLQWKRVKRHTRDDIVPFIKDKWSKFQKNRDIDKIIEILSKNGVLVKAIATPVLVARARPELTAKEKIRRSFDMFMGNIGYSYHSKIAKGLGRFSKDKSENYARRHGLRGMLNKERPEDKLLEIFEKPLPVYLVRGPANNSFYGKMARNMWKGFNFVGLGKTFTKLFGFTGRSFNDVLLDKLNQITDLLDQLNGNVKKSSLSQIVSLTALAAGTTALVSTLPVVSDLMSSLTDSLPNILTNIDPLFAGIAAAGAGLFGLFSGGKKEKPEEQTAKYTKKQFKYTKKLYSSSLSIFDLVFKISDILEEIKEKGLSSNEDNTMPRFGAMPASKGIFASYFDYKKDIASIKSKNTLGARTPQSSIINAIDNTNLILNKIYRRFDVYFSSMGGQVDNQLNLKKTIESLRDMNIGVYNNMTEALINVKDALNSFGIEEETNKGTKRTYRRKSKSDKKRTFWDYTDMLFEKGDPGSKNQGFINKHIKPQFTKKRFFDTREQRDIFMKDRGLNWKKGDTGNLKEHGKRWFAKKKTKDEIQAAKGGLDSVGCCRALGLKLDSINDGVQQVAENILNLFTAMGSGGVGKKKSLFMKMLGLGGSAIKGMKTLLFGRSKEEKYEKDLTWKGLLKRIDRIIELMAGTTSGKKDDKKRKGLLGLAGGLLGSKGGLLGLAGGGGLAIGTLIKNQLSDEMMDAIGGTIHMMINNIKSFVNGIFDKETKLSNNVKRAESRLNKSIVRKQDENVERRVEKELLAEHGSFAQESMIPFVKNKLTIKDSDLQHLSENQLLYLINKGGFNRDDKEKLINVYERKFGKEYSKNERYIYSKQDEIVEQPVKETAQVKSEKLLASLYAKGVISDTFGYDTVNAKKLQGLSKDELLSILANREDLKDFRDSDASGKTFAGREVYRLLQENHGVDSGELKKLLGSMFWSDHEKIYDMFDIERANVGGETHANFKSEEDANKFLAAIEAMKGQKDKEKADAMQNAAITSKENSENQRIARQSNANRSVSTSQGTDLTSRPSKRTAGIQKSDQVASNGPLQSARNPDSSIQRIIDRQMAYGIA